MTTRIGILEVGRTPEELIPSYPSYADMVAQWLSPIEAITTIYPIIDGATFPQVEQANLWVITGSRCGVYEDHAWIPPLTEFIQQAKISTAKMLGICFGHQIIAQALGGKVIKSDRGWGVGLHNYQYARWPVQLTRPLSELNINAYHQDQVVNIPAESILLAGSSFCPNGMLWYPGFGITFQGHPEFNNDFTKDLIKLRQSSGHLPNHIAENGLASLEGQNTRLELGEWFSSIWEEL